MKATNEELRGLLKVSKQQERAQKNNTKTQKSPAAIPEKSIIANIEVLPSDRYTEDPTGQPILFPSPAHMLAVLKPEFTCYPWQAEMLLQLAGYLNPKDLSVKSVVSPELPFRLCLPAANGSGKDLVVIAAFSVWFALSGLRNLSVWTSGSYEQLKFQTEIHIRDLCKTANKKFGKIFHSVEFYHVCTQTSSEIKLFATDESGRAEGWHPRPGGQMSIGINEAKTVPDTIRDALSRCTGYSYWLEVSSPAFKTGGFYRASLGAVRHPDLPILGEWFYRKVPVSDCPHIPKSHIKEMRRVKSIEWCASSLDAEFTDLGSSNIIKVDLWDTACTTLVTTSDLESRYAIGGDLAAGGDECSFYLRKGSKLIDQYHFYQKDTTLTADFFDKRFYEYKNIPKLIIRLDDGGIGKGVIDTLVRLGWKNIQRIHNQAPATLKYEFLNIGAQYYFHLQRLLQLGYIQPPKDEKLRRQATSRRYDQREEDGGKYRLEPKPEHIARERESPDRSDAYVLCYSSYPVSVKSQLPSPKPPIKSLAELEEELTWGKETNYDEHNRKPSYRSSYIVADV